MINFLGLLLEEYTISLLSRFLTQEGEWITWKDLFLPRKIGVAERGRSKRRGGRKGWEGERAGGHIFREQGWPRGNFATRVFPQDLCLPTPRLTMSLASYTVIIAPPPRFPVHRLLPRKLSSPITGVWPFFGICAMLIRKFLPLPRIFFSFPAESTFPTRRAYPLPLFSPR